MLYFESGLLLIGLSVRCLLSLFSHTLQAVVVLFNQLCGLLSLHVSNCFLLCLSSFLITVHTSGKALPQVNQDRQVRQAKVLVLFKFKLQTQAEEHYEQVVVNSVAEIPLQAHQFECVQCRQQEWDVLDQP
jgi:hypothetical protein